MRRRIALLGALILALIGIVAIAPETSALNSTGIHTVSFSCNEGSHHSTTAFTYSMTSLGTTNDAQGNPYKWNYQFQLLSSTFQGTTPPSGRSPSLSITNSGVGTPNGDLYLSAGFGGSQTTDNYTWPRYMAHNTTTGGPTTITDGITPLPVGTTQPGGGTILNWVPVNVSITPAQEGNNYLKFFIYNIPNGGCTQYLDLGFPDAPVPVGQQSKLFWCGTGNVPNYTMYINYTVASLGGNTYSFHVNEADFAGGDDATFGRPDYISMDISGLGRPAEEVDSGSGNWSNPSSDTFIEQHGVGGVSFPTVTWNYQPGQTPNVGIIFTYGAGGAEACDDSIDLGYSWQSAAIPAQAGTEDIPFDDCSGSGTTHLRVQPSWQKTANGDAYRLTALTITQTNGSGSTIVLDPGTNTVPGGVTLAEGVSSATSLTTINSNVSLADRTITNGESQVIPIATNNKWTKISAPSSHSSAPTSFYTLTDDHPSLAIRGKVYNSIGAQCNPSGPGDISKLDFHPDGALG